MVGLANPAATQYSQVNYLNIVDRAFTTTSGVLYQTPALDWHTTHLIDNQIDLTIIETYKLTISFKHSY